jgi:hypothetical protein
MKADKYIRFGKGMNYSQQMDFELARRLYSQLGNPRYRLRHHNIHHMAEHQS